jgi:phosphoglucosamine mutase
MVRLGHGIAKVLCAHSIKPKVLIGKDTRLSGYLLESGLEAGLIASGVDVLLTGPIPTPAIGYLTKAMRADLGLVISASHNPFFDNGIKFIFPSGDKVNGQQAIDLEKYLHMQVKMKEGHAFGKALRVDGAVHRYVERCKSKLMHVPNLKRLKIVIDCANGASYQCAKLVFEELNADVIAIHDKPNGLNINANCGATDLASLSKKVVEVGADCGLAFDGDSDRLMMVDHLGKPFDGDDILWCLSLNQPRYSQIQGCVKTVMSNGAMDAQLQQRGIDCITVPVGDQHVMAALKSQKWVLGAEPSGHILTLDASSMGDGIIAGILVLETLLLLDKPLSDLRLPHRFQQVVGSLKLGQDVDRVELGKKIDRFELSLGENIRSVIRPSGTEPKLRYLFEGEQGLMQIEKAFKAKFAHEL